MGLKAVANLGSGGGAPVGGSGTPGTLAKFTGTGTSIGNSLLSESGTTITSAATAETFGSAQTWTVGAPNSQALVVKSNAGPESTLILDTISRAAGIGGAPGTLLHVQDNAGFPFAGSTYEGVRLQRATQALFSASDYTRSFRAGLTGATAVVGTSTAHDLLLQRGNVTALTLGASGAVAFAGNLTSSATQTWTLATGTSALNIASNLLNLDTTNSRVGIGTASPASKLDVAGTITCDDAGTGLKLPATPGNADAQTLDCYAETDVSAGYTLSGVTTTSGAITVAIRATRIGRTMTFAVSIAPAGGASLTFAAAWYLTMTGVSAPAFAGSLAVSSNDATITRGAAWVSAVAGPTVYGSAAALGVNVSLFLNGTI